MIFRFKNFVIRLFILFFILQSHLIMRTFWYFLNSILLKNHLYLILSHSIDSFSRSTCLNYLPQSIQLEFTKAIFSKNLRTFLCVIHFSKDNNKATSTWAKIICFPFNKYFFALSVKMWRNYCESSTLKRQTAVLLLSKI